MRHWPDTLPTAIAPGYQLVVADQYLRSDMEIGPARARRLTRARRDQVQAAWVMSPVEFEVFRAWFEDLPWSLAGHSDDLAHWTPIRATWVPGAALSPSGVLVGRLMETADTGTHYLARALPDPGPVAVDILVTVSIRAAGRTTARVVLAGRDGVGRRLDVDLTTGAGGNAFGLTAWSVEERGDGWWRVTILATSAVGGGNLSVFLQALSSPGVTSYAGDIARGLDLAEVNVRLPTGADLYLPTDSAGQARGAAGGAAWAMMPVWVGGVVKPVETRFERTFSAEVKTGLNTNVSAPLEVRYA